MSSPVDFTWCTTWTYDASSGQFLLFSLVTVAKATVILFTAQGLCLAIRRSSASARHLILSSAMISLLLLPLAWWVPTPYGLDLGSRFVLPTGEALVVEDHPQAAVPLVGQTILGPSAGRSLFAAAALTLGIVWAGGAVVFLTRLLIGLFRVRFLIREALPVRLPRMAEALQKAREEAGLTRQVRLLETELLPSPASWGVLRPVVLLPGDAAEWDSRRLHLVLVHELAHIRRIDTFTQLSVQMCSALYWFHPLVWTTATQIRREREMACDDVVLSRGWEPGDYADHLLQMARRVRSGGAPWGLAAAMAQRSYLEDRLHALLSPTTNRQPLTGRSRTMTAAIMSVVMLLAISIGVPAPQGKATLTGIVRDALGTPVQGARILVSTTDGNRQDLVLTGRDGEYRFEGLAEGVYNVEVAARYFKRVLLPEVALTAGRTATKDVRLEVGQIVEEVTVVSQQPAGTTKPSAGGAGLSSQPRPPKLVRHVNPVYPPEAKQAGVTGLVVLTAVVGTDGVPRDVKAVSQIIDERLARAAVEAVKQWRWEPLRLGNEPVEFKTSVTVRYELE